jgi:hypothetical protein
MLLRLVSGYLKNREPSTPRLLRLCVLTTVLSVLGIAAFGMPSSLTAAASLPPLTSCSPAELSGGLCQSWTLTDPSGTVLASYLFNPAKPGCLRYSQTQWGSLCIVSVTRPSTTSSGTCIAPCSTVLDAVTGLIGTAGTKDPVVCHASYSLGGWTSQGEEFLVDHQCNDVVAFDAYAHGVDQLTFGYGAANACTGQASVQCEEEGWISPASPFDRFTISSDAVYSILDHSVGYMTNPDGSYCHVVDTYTASCRWEWVHDYTAPDPCNLHLCFLPPPSPPKVG